MDTAESLMASEYLVQIVHKAGRRVVTSWDPGSHIGANAFPATMTWSFSVNVSWAEVASF